MSQRKKIIFLSTSLDYGGAENQVVQVARCLKFRGWFVHVVSMLYPKAYVDELTKEGISVSSLYMSKGIPDPRAIFRLVRILKIVHPSVFHSHMVHANLLARLVRLLVPVPVLICTAHSINEGGWVREIFYRITDPFCDLTTQVSQAGMERYININAVSRHKIRYIPNGIDISQFKPDIKTRIRMRKYFSIEDKFVWLAVGRLHSQKDYFCMLKAFSKVAWKNQTAVLLIVGSGPLRSTIEKLASCLGIDNRVYFLGIRKDIPQLMNAADAYVMSSVLEGMPIVLLEAAATGLAIVATDVGGNREVVLNDETGFLVPSENHDILANAMIQLMELPEKSRIAMGERARQYVERRYALGRVIDQWESLYEEFLNKI